MRCIASGDGITARLQLNPLPLTEVLGGPKRRVQIEVKTPAAEGCSPLQVPPPHFELSLSGLST